MFWLILSIILIVLCVWTIKKSSVNTEYDDPYEILMILSGFGFLINFIIFICILFSGSYTYSNLKSDYAKVKVLQKRIIDIKNAKYEYRQDGSLVAGSIENIEQSSVLSHYINNVANKEAEYNGNLEEAKAKKENFILSFFTDGFFISDKIYELKKL